MNVLKRIGHMIYDNDVSLYERLWRKYVVRDTICRGDYLVMFTKTYYRYLKKHDPEMLATVNVGEDRILQRIDPSDYKEIAYMMGGIIVQPGIRCYLEYTSGRRRRIRLGLFGRRTR